MDYLNYALDWAEQKEEEGLTLPSKRLPVAAAQYDLLRGEHPIANDIHPDYFTRTALSDPQNENVSLELQPRPMGCVHGHNTLADAGFTSLLNVDVNIPISPLFVRDLAGRTIHIGYGPERKSAEDWEAYNLEKNPTAARTTFPKNCTYISDDTEHADIIESVFFLKFRTLDMAFDYAGVPSGNLDEVAAGIYNNANLYPYKLRIDSFYTDGYKLPQTQMLYARQDISAPKANLAAQAFMEKWHNRPVNQSYADFHTENDGDNWFESLFNQGCTVIPTFEAANGYNIVNEEFMLEDYHPGRVVSGLHEVTESRASDLPLDTILAVIEPGYVTQDKVVPAKVITSDGSGYVSPHEETSPAPQVPNLHLPHQRTTSNWWACWLPTHPEHFEPPAIWGWDNQTGRFLQQRGPIWDPLHYYYSCTDEIIQAFKKPRVDNRWLVDVPEHMHDKFHPIIPMKGFDTISEESLLRRQARNTLPRSAVTRIRNGKVTAGIGYHPLPIQFEYELDSFWFPELSPLNRLTSMAPEALFDRLAEVVQPNILPSEYQEHVNGPEEATWLFDENLLSTPTAEPLKNFPHLIRYTEPDLDMAVIMELTSGLFLEDMSDDFLNMSAQERWNSVDSYDDLETIAPGLFNAVWDMRDNAVKLNQLRHKLYRRNPALYAYAWWFCVPLGELEAFFDDWEVTQNPPERKQDKIRTGAIVGAAVTDKPL